MMAVNTILPRSPDSIGDARRLVDAHTSSFGPQQQADAALMVSELVTNALVHGTGTIGLRIDLEPDALRVEVSDQGRDPATPQSHTRGSRRLGSAHHRGARHDWASRRQHEGLVPGSTAARRRLSSRRPLLWGLIAFRRKPIVLATGGSPARLVLR